MSSDDTSQAPSAIRDRIFTAAIFLFLLVFVGSVAGLILADVFYTNTDALLEVLQSRQIWAAARLSLWTSLLTTAIGLVFAVPIAYALSRYEFPGRLLADTIVDIPIVFPPLIMGLSLLILFRTQFRLWLESLGLEVVYEPPGIVLAQFFVSVSFGIRAIKTAFDDADRRQEDVALTLGCTRGQAFWRVAVPNARGGILAGGILTWARAFGVFGPLMVFVGAVRMRTEVLPTTVYLETSIGRIEVALAVALVMIVLAGIALTLIRLFGGRSLW